MNIVPICFSTDDNYAIPTSVAIRSIVNSNNNGDFIFIVLYKDTLNEKNKKSLIKAAKNIKLNFIDVKDRIVYTYQRISHISESAYYRFLLPELLPTFDKCLYLDGDICVKSDISSLLQIKLNKDEYIAAIKCESVINSVITEKYKHAKELGIKTLKGYINSGVLLMNLERMRELNLGNRMVQLIKNNYSIQDQDIVNIVCFNHIKHVSPVYNAVPALFEKKYIELFSVYSLKEIYEAKKNPIIVHYANRAKPWNTIGLIHEDVWNETYHELYQNELNKLNTYHPIAFIERKIIIIRSAFRLVIRLIRR